MARQNRTQNNGGNAASRLRHDVPRLAKLTRPQLSDAIPRLRLFKLLHDGGTKPLIWIQAPPGAGKTTLVASYLTANNISGIWYQIDRDDADLASFFYYLGLAAPSTGRRKQQPLPPLTPEYLLDIESFTRRFFRELCSRLSDSAALVFDNYQEVGTSSSFHKIMACGLSEVPQGVHVIILSRMEPPPEYARYRANNLVAQLGWDDLRLTLDEASLIATARQPIDAELVQSLHTQSEGWTAGLVLMLEQFKQSGTVSHSGQHETLDTVFNYFAGEIVDRLDGGTRDFLIRTCLLPQVTAELASKLTGRSDAAGVLAKLHQRQLFIDRRLVETLTYQYHALFIRFLQSQAKSSLTEAEYQALMVASAEALASQGQMEKAVPLLVAAQAWQPAIQLIVTQAQGLLALGRWQTVQQWIDSLPAPVRNTTPWLGFWLGMCRLRIDPAQARQALEPAFAFFQKTEDMLGQALAATAIIEAHMVEWVDYRRLDPWIASLEALLSRRDILFPSSNTELAVRASLFAAIVYRQTYREDIPCLARQLGDMLRHDLDPNYKLWAATGIFIYSAYSGDFVLTEQVISYTKAAFYSPAATAVNRAWYGSHLGYALRYVKGSREKAREWFRKVREIVREHGLRFFEAPLAINWAWAEEVFGEIEDIERELRILETHLNPESGSQMSFQHMGIVFLRARQNDLDAALAHVRETLPFVRQSGHRLGQLAAAIGLTGVCLRRNDFRGAQEALDQALTFFFPCPLRSYVDGMFGARIALGMKEEGQAQIKLRLVLSLGAKHGLENTLSEHLFRPMTASLCAYALKHGIEADYAERIIRAQHLSAPSVDIEEWPWQVRIYVLGRFTVQVDGQPLVFAGKVPKKPLELLKALVAAGGSSVDAGWLGEQLWPDTDAARVAFNVTHSRLRKLLPVEDVLVLDEGKLSLNTALVWTDVGAFERSVEQCLSRLRQDPLPEEMASLSENVLSLYAGELLKGEVEAPWLIIARDRVRSKFLRMLKALGVYLEEQEAWGQAQGLYERVLEIDNVAEDIYRRLMRCYTKAGQPAEALRVYQRCRQILSLVLGIAPSNETETLFQAIRLPRT